MPGSCIKKICESKASVINNIMYLSGKKLIIIIDLSFNAQNQIKMRRKISVLPLFILLCLAFDGLNAKVSRTPLSDATRSDTLKRMAVTDSIKSKEGGTLDEAVVIGHSSEKDVQMRTSLNTVNTDRKYIEENFGGSLMQSLSKIPGVKANVIGSGESKPTIRGLGTNRILVAENGIKHEGQQWGDDHGLEADQFSVENVEIVKGPAALAYGSDAIGGVINLKSDIIPVKRFGGSVNLFVRSNNESVGATGKIGGNLGRFWYKANGTFVGYADYKVPADSIQYYSYYIKLCDRRLRNTAGREADGSLALGYEGDGWRTSLRISNVNTRSGFFADAHGLEVRMSDIDYNASRRDIDLPYHTVNHLFVSNHTERTWGSGTLTADLGWQNNRQREYSEPVSHGYMPTPSNDLERSFGKNTFSAIINARQTLGANTLNMGVNAECQLNRTGGWGFILPDFERRTFGAYVSDRTVINERLILSGGIRYDYGRVNIHSYKDWFKTPTADGDSVYMERSADLRKRFRSLTWSTGINGRFGDFVLKANIGKSFRMPAMKELGMDGVNYNIFRYEKGNSNLRPEESYQIDAGIVYEQSSVKASFTPFVNYFPNYIYLNPTPDYQEGLQLYYYTQSRVFRWGAEASLELKLNRNLELDASAEYLHSRQLNGEKKGYSLPMSPPWSASARLRYNLPATDAAKGGFAAIEYVVVGDQNEVAPPEEPTSGYQLVNISLGKSLPLGKDILRLTLRCDNLLGVRHYDHTSYYRLIGVPAPGRDISVMAAWNF